MLFRISRAWQYMTTVMGMIFHHPLLGVSIIPLLPNGNIVLIRRRDTGKWAIPGGFVNWGEDIPTSASRELQEETGLQMLKINRLVGIYSAPDRDPRVHSICVVIVADVQGQIAIQDTLEVDEVKAFSLQDLPIDDLSFDHGRHIQDYITGVTTVA